MPQKSGESHPNSKLTQDDVDRIRRPDQHLSDQALADAIGVDRSTVRLVRLNAQWHDPGYVPREAQRGRPKAVDAPRRPSFPARLETKEDGA